MTEPLKKGDRARVVGGLGRHKSPNLRKIVEVGESQGEHTQHGRIVRCISPEVVQMTDSGSYVKLGWADFAVAWLEKLPPDDEPPATTQTNKELEIL